MMSLYLTLEKVPRDLPHSPIHLSRSRPPQTHPLLIYRYPGSISHSAARRLSARQVSHQQVIPMHQPPSYPEV